MNSPPPLEFPQYIDATMRSTFVSCPRKFFYEYIMKLSKAGISPDLHAGGCMAAAIETTRRAYYESNLPLQTCIERGLEHLTIEWGDYEPPDKNDKPHNKTYNNTASAFIEYWEHFDPRFDILKPYRNSDGSIAAEYSFAIPTPIKHPTSGEPILYAGRFDLLGYFDGAPDNLYIVDEKTTGSLGAAWAKKWDMRGQFLGYTHAARQSGIRIEGAIVRGIGILQTKTHFAQAILPISNWQVERYWEQLLIDLTRMLECYKHYKKDELYRVSEVDRFSFDQVFGETCEQYGGCSFMPLCTVERPELWYSDYETRHWNPLKRNPTEPDTQEASLHA